MISQKRNLLRNLGSSSNEIAIEVLSNMGEVKAEIIDNTKIRIQKSKDTSRLTYDKSFSFKIASILNPSSLLNPGEFKFYIRSYEHIDNENIYNYYGHYHSLAFSLSELFNPVIIFKEHDQYDQDNNSLSGNQILSLTFENSGIIPKDAIFEIKYFSTLDFQVPVNEKCIESTLENPVCFTSSILF